MAGGGPGDHPLFDVINYNIETYGKEADELLKKLVPLMSDQELWKWWDEKIGWECDPATALIKIKQQYDVSLERAKKSGWELS